MHLGKLRKLWKFKVWLTLPIDILVVNNGDQECDMIVGQNFLDHKDVKIIRENGVLTVLSSNENSIWIGNMQENNLNNNDTQNVTLNFSSLKIGDNLDRNEKTQIFNLIAKYKQCFADNLAELGKTNAIEMNILVRFK